jgi:hypothetical protein
MIFSHTQKNFIFEHYFTDTSFAAVIEKFRHVNLLQDDNIQGVFAAGNVVGL